MDIQSLFLTAFRDAAPRRGETPTIMGMFMSAASESPERYCYFTPDTQALAPEFLRAVRAQAVDAPSRVDVQFLAGDDVARSQLWKECPEI